MNDREMLLICYGAMKGNPELVGDPVLELLEQHVLKTKAKPKPPKSFDPQKLVPPAFNPSPRPPALPPSGPGEFRKTI